MRPDGVQVAGPVNQQEIEVGRDRHAVNFVGHPRGGRILIEEKDVAGAVEGAPADKAGRHRLGVTGGRVQRRVAGDGVDADKKQPIAESWHSQIVSPSFLSVERPMAKPPFTYRP